MLLYVHHCRCKHNTIKNLLNTEETRKIDPKFDVDNKCQLTQHEVNHSKRLLCIDFADLHVLVDWGRGYNEGVSLDAVR